MEKNPNYSEWAQRPLEQILILAENSESTDAIRLAAEIRRLSSVEKRLQELEDHIKANIASVQAARDLTQRLYIVALVHNLSFGIEMGKHQLLLLDAELNRLRGLLREG